MGGQTRCAIASRSAVAPTAGTQQPEMGMNQLSGSVASSQSHHHQDIDSSSCWQRPSDYQFASGTGPRRYEAGGFNENPHHFGRAKGPGPLGGRRTNTNCNGGGGGTITEFGTILSNSNFQDHIAQYFHLTPFKKFRRLSSGVLERVWDELYSSDAWLEEHDRLQRLPSSDGLEKVIVGLMFWSDATHLAQFGTAKAWPIYLAFGNLSKYLRGQSRTDVAHHVAYLPSLPTTFHEYLTSVYGKLTRKTLKEVTTHCRRELFHATWRKLLDDDFLKAYREGLPIKCADGIMRRVYPRIFTYSADYPEKVLIACIRDLGKCGCPRCLTPTCLFGEMGFVRDLTRRITLLRTWTYPLRVSIMAARNFIYALGTGVGSTSVQKILKSKSWTPTVNAFADRLGDQFDVFKILAVDFMHEVELGVWKSLFTHLIRLLYACDPTGRLVVVLNSSFGRLTIRRFGEEMSEMKNLPARTFENLLQCAMPAFEGLFPCPYDNYIQTLLYRLAEWHALAKLRMHTDTTLAHLESATATLGREVRGFVSRVCSQFDTIELPKEAAARARRQQAQGVPQDASTSSSTRRLKTFNLNTYKLHALADYVKTIRLYGTVDSYTTKLGELWHRRVKRLWASSNKHSAERGISRQERRETLLKRSASARTATNETQVREHHLSFETSEPLSGTELEMQHHISESTTTPKNIYTFVSQMGDDPAAKVGSTSLFVAQALRSPVDLLCTQNFIPKLKDHLLTRLRGEVYDGDEVEYSDEERAQVRIIGSKIYCHKVLRLQYTTYDARRGQDSINPRTTHCNVLLNSRETGPSSHPFWYAQVLGIFHARVLHVGPNVTNRSAQHMEFLTNELLPHQSVARPPGQTDDWARFYVNIFADRDMFMRYFGGGVGHPEQPPYRYQTSTLVREDDPEPLPTDNDAGVDGASETSSDESPSDEEELDDVDEDGEYGFDAVQDSEDLGPEDGEDSDGDSDGSI
ncbi:hypothetical protein NLI96_g4423 [Meripilus lineatus]|uniref:Uncharacterized protein n=1 Tax=Meripilus lineatus TaxID=2056292 RepID=A0AAD5YET4_9APHY|nr:hypothetical protein NLI96_g4423 [Physisporinus lineatus]